MARHDRFDPRRRHFLGAALGLGAVALLAPRTARAGRTRVLLVGDSMVATAFGETLEEGLTDAHGYRVRRRGKSATGLARPDYFDWHQEADKLMSAHRPDAVVVMLGGNDAQALYAGPRDWIKWGDDGWTDAYALRVRALGEQLSPDGQTVIWIGLPLPRNESYARKLEHVNAVIEATARDQKHGHFVSTWNSLADGRGRFTDVLPDARGRVQKVRADDGIHLTMAGARHLEGEVRGRIHELVDGHRS